MHDERDGSLDHSTKESIFDGLIIIGEENMDCFAQTLRTNSSGNSTLQFQDDVWVGIMQELLNLVHSLLPFVL